MIRDGNQIDFNLASDREGEIFFLIYDPPTLKCLCFGIFREEVKFKFLIIRILKHFSELIYGDPKKSPKDYWSLLING